MVKPEIEYLFHSHWLVSTPKPLMLTWVCRDKTFSKEINSVDVIKLEEGCSVSFNFFAIPIQTTGTVLAEQEVKFGAEIEIAKLSPNKWDDTGSLPKILSDTDFELTDIRKELPQIKDIPVEYLHKLLSKHVVVNVPESKCPKKFIAVPVTFILLAIVIIQR